MNNDQVNQLIQGIGAMVELWTITYSGFKKQGFSDKDAVTHTEAFMSIMMSIVMGTNTEGDKT